MVAIPLLEEAAGGSAARLVSELAETDVTGEVAKKLEESLGHRDIPRKFAIYGAAAGFDLLEELDHLTFRTIEPNIFVNPRFLAPAMPRLDDRQVRFMVMRDESETRSRLRFLMPYTIERPGIAVSAPIIRAWATPFGPQGTPLIDRDDPVSVLEDLFDILSRRHLKMPEVLVLPDMRSNGSVAQLIRSIALGRNLPLTAIERVERPFLESRMEGDAYLRQAIGSHHRRDYARLWRKLAGQGNLSYSVARSPEEIRRRFENFLALEAGGWKGKRGSAMAVDRYRAAFAREAVNRLAERDLARIHTLELDGQPVAILIVFVEAGEAWTWKTAYDEDLSAYSPGTLLMIEVVKNHLEDPNIARTDSCAVPDHPVMSRLFHERETIETLVIGLNPAAHRATQQAASQIHLYRRTRDIARMVRNRLRHLTGRH
ncbi:type IV secretion system effector crotonyl transferase BspF [Phyllobacterium leguminum]|uniref:Acetyltransferase (GNAT) family protein n=1 Tax=Phyllobacterium leguminum TaxID=314237 RepID=A0A318T8E9_9HYPH|nr:GNAT family N-acetyltransferase [Phyllobacterium leguminum]PYE88973.1 acetyltransferase (GNAT) family protein [Phyllobacterium leguminum]